MVGFIVAKKMIEIWDLAGDGVDPRNKVVTISQNTPVARLVRQVATMFQRSVGTFGLLLKWGRNKVNLMNVRRDLTLADLGVDLESEATFTLLITEWPPSPSESDELTMPRVDGDSSSFVLDMLDLSRGFARSNLKIDRSTRVIDLFHHVAFLCNHKAGTFSLILRRGWIKIELNDKDTRKLSEVGVVLSSPLKAMLLVEMTSESPINDTEAEASTPTENNTAESSYQKLLQDFATSLDSNTGHTMNPTVVDEESAPSPSTDALSQVDNWVLTLDDHLEMMKKNEIIEKDDRGESGYKYGGYVTRVERRVGRVDTEESDPSDENVYVGLVNQAMTCYLNSLIQALYMTPEFRNALYNWEYVYDSDKDEAKSIPYQLQKLFLNLQTSSKNAIETTSLTKSFGWDSTQAWQQHDIQELCRVMFDALEQKFKNTEQADLINRLYEGKMIDYVKCLECGTEKSREDTFLDIPLPVRPFGSNVAYNSVEEALAAFVQPETLDGTNQYHCETCNKKCDAHKGLKFTKFPYFLTLHLKRFDFDYNTFHRIKLNDEVTFPDVLNLNSFIPSTASEDSASTEESAGASAVKSEDGSTTDSGTQEDLDRPPCDNGISGASENSAPDNHQEDVEKEEEDEDDEDEGIERSNGPSTSSCNPHNHDCPKNRESVPGPKGPYMYELFSIMIHSGSASGGHYYAYIKDFRTGEWLCFNDQNVTPITYDDIQKTYGGGPTRAYYSGVYSSSSNAYMLMYRQIDPARNALPMQVADFPKHLQELLIGMQESEYNDMKNRGMLLRRYRNKILCYHPVKKTLMDIKLCFRKATLEEITDRAYKGLNLDTLVDRDQVRLVTYQESTGLINHSFEGREQEPISSIQTGRASWFLEIRKKDEPFKTYLPGGIAKRAYLIDITTKEVIKGPVVVRGLMTQTVQEFKEQLGLAFGMDVKDLKVVVQYLNDPPRLFTSNESTLPVEGFADATRIFVVTASGPVAKKNLEDVLEICYLVCGLILLNVHLPSLSEEDLRDQGIPTLEEKRLADATPLTNGPPKASSSVETTKETEKVENNETATKSTDTDESSTTWNKTSPATQTETENWHTPEQSNSEDSSLSYSDRTLVGEGDASEDEDYPCKSSDEVVNEDRNGCIANVDHEIFSQLNQDNGQIKDPSEYLVKVTRDEHQPDTLLRVLYDKQMGLGTLKKLLEPHVGVPAEYLRVFCQPNADMECARLSLDTSQEESASIWLKLGLALRNSEIKVSIFQLCTDSETDPFKFLCEWIVSKDATVGQTKREILAHLKKKFAIDIPFERCRLRRKSYKTASNVCLDDKKIKDLRFYWREIIVQELPGKETITDDTGVALFARRIPRNGVTKGPLEEFVVNVKSFSEVREKISELSGIPDEHLEIAKGKSSLPDHLMLLMQHKLLDWYCQGSNNAEFQSPFLDDGTVIYYRDTREMLQELFFPDIQDVSSRRRSRFCGGSAGTISRSGPRGERALKIYLDDM